MELAQYLGHVRADGSALLAAARPFPEHRVPSCPEWDVAGLVGHTGWVHRWVEGMVRTRAAARGKVAVPPPEGWDDRCDWYEEGLAALVGALTEIDPDEPVWNWADRAPAPARFWHRRMAHETAVHRWDAQNAVGEAGPLDPSLSADGIGEYLGFVGLEVARTPVPDLSGRLGLVAQDADLAVVVALTPDALTVEPVDRAPGGGLEAVPGGVDATVRGTAGELLLWLTGRRRARGPGIEVDGDAAVLGAWERSIMFG